MHKARDPKAIGEGIEMIPEAKKEVCLLQRLPVPLYPRPRSSIPMSQVPSRPLSPKPPTVLNFVEVSLGDDTTPDVTTFVEPHIFFKVPFGILYSWQQAWNLK